jgi:hypothetical protein
MKTYVQGKCIHHSGGTTTRYKLGLVGVQEIRWDRGDTGPTDEYTFYCGVGTRIMN